VGHSPDELTVRVALRVVPSASSFIVLARPSALPSGSYMRGRIIGLALGRKEYAGSSAALRRIRSQCWERSRMRAAGRVVSQVLTIALSANRTIPV